MRENFEESRAVVVQPMYRMRRREFVIGSMAVLPVVARAQQPERTARIGVLVPTTQADPNGQALLRALQEGLQKRGWFVGRNIVIDYRWGIASKEKTHAAIADLLPLEPDAILASTSETVAALQQATRTVPIVFTTIYEPVSQGFVQSLAHPGGNITGFANFEASLGGKWVELLKQIAPQTTRAVFMSNPDNPGPMQSYVSVEQAGPQYGVSVTKAPVHGAGEIEAAIAALNTPHKGLIVPADGFLLQQRHLIIQLCARHNVPAIYGLSLFATDGGLASYGIDVSEQFRQAAGYIDRILRGEKAGDLPVQQPTKYEFVINLKAAKTLDIASPQTVLAIADQVIE